MREEVAAAAAVERGNGSCELSRMYKGLVDGGGEGIMC